MRNIITIIFLLPLAMVFACQGPEKLENTTKENAQEELVNIDSIQIDILGQVGLLDVSSDASLFFLYDYARSSYIIWDRDAAEITYSFEINTDKEHAAYPLRTPSFHNGSELLFGGTRGLIFYDYNGNVQRYFPHEKPLFPRLLYSLPSNFIYPVNFQNKEKFLFPPVKHIPHAPSEANFYDEWRCLSVFDPESGTLEHIVPLPKDSRFFNGRAYNYSHLKSTYTVINDTLWLNLGGEDILRAYSISNDLEPLASISLKMLGYELPESLSPENLDLNSVINYRKAMQGVKSIFAYGDDLALVYFPGFSKSQRESMNLVKDTDGMAAHQEYATKLFESIPSRLQIISKRGEIIKDVAIPLTHKAFELIIRNEEIWVQKKESVEFEEDFIQLYRLDF